MSIAVATSSSLTASAAALAQSAAASAASANSSSSSSSSSSSTANALSSLTSNFNTFLTLLTTQLQNQDPTSPMSSDTFTSELAQFAGVEQQVKTNTNLSQLITLGQESAVSDSQSLVGSTVQISGSQIALQNGSSTLNYTATAAEPVAIAITDSTGTVVRTATVEAAKGSNSWTWDGTNNSGATLSDGLYSAAIVAQSDTDSTTALNFTSTGTVTAITSGSDGTTDAQLGTATLPLSSVQAVTTKGATTTSS